MRHKLDNCTLEFQDNDKVNRIPNVMLSFVVIGFIENHLASMILIGDVSS